MATKKSSTLERAAEVSAAYTDEQKRETLAIWNQLNFHSRLEWLAEGRALIEARKQLEAKNG